MNRYEVITVEEVVKFIKSLDGLRRGRVDRIYDLFEEFGPLLPTKYLKKLSRKVWELRPGDMRLFLTIEGNKGYIVHAIFKKTQKTPLRDLELAKKRVGE